MSQGRVLEAGTKLGRLEVRKPGRDDAPSLMQFINELIEEDAQLLVNKKCNLKEEKAWLLGKLKEVSEKKTVYLVCAHGDRIIGAVEVKKGRFREEHTGEFGIAILKKYRNIGLGTHLARIILKEARKILKVKLVWLRVFETNLNAIKVYRRLGFKRDARLRKRIKYKGKYVNVLIMSRQA